jgi:short-subunit dehydrogenase
VELAGAVVVVTGASRGIGAAVADQLAARGALPVRVARSAGDVVLDLREQGSADELVAAVRAEYGRLDAVVLNAGIGHAGPVEEMSAERVADLVATNLTAPLQLTRAALPHVRSLVFVSSIAGALGVPGEAVYSATKAGIESFAEVLRVEHPEVAVSTVLPGVVATGFFDDRGQAYDRRFPRPMRPEKAARVVVRALEHGTPKVIVPRWLGVPARLHAVMPRTYRALEKRFG